MTWLRVDLIKHMRQLPEGRDDSPLRVLGLNSMPHRGMSASQPEATLPASSQFDPERTFQLLNFCANIGLVIIKKGRALEGDFLCPS